jgi:hypothetical protein
MKKHYRKENDCLNCGTILQGKFCHNCGQENLQMKESFGHMMNHAISDYFHFDDQFFHTMKPLFLKPGFLTNQYMAGHRAGYLHPVKMYIFISLVFFIVMFQTDHQVMTVNQPEKVKKVSQAAIDSIQKDPEIPGFTKKILIDGMKKGEGTVTNNHGIISVQVGGDKTSGGFLDPTTSDTSYKAYIASQQKLPPDKRDGIFERLYNKKVFGYKTEYGSMAQKIIVENFEHNIPKMMFVLLPICALILMIAFRDKTKYYVEYLIYSFHLHSFIFLYLTILMLLQLIIPSEIINSFLSFISFLVIVWYIYKSLRVVFNRSKFRTITKMIGSYLMYLLSFVVVITLVFFITALMA